MARETVLPGTEAPLDVLVTPPQVLSLHNELSALYPELPAEVITSALEGAHLAAMSLAGRGPVPDAWLRTLVCDRLDLALARCSARQRWETNRRRDHGRPGEHGPGTVACTYCRASIPADEFSFWSEAKRLRSASCPCCRRRVTILAATWRRQTERRPAEPRRLPGCAGRPDAASP
jgi:hypothetical protein